MKRKKLFKILIALAVFLIVLILFNALFMNDSAEGLYLFKGTDSLLELKRNFGFFHAGADYTESEHYRFHDAFYRDDRLVLVYRFENYEFIMYSAYIFTPSTAGAGDWDLAAKSSSLDEDPESFLDPDNLQTLERPVPSALHRVDEYPWLKKYYRRLRHAENPAADLELIAEKSGAHPKDAYLSQLYLEALSYHGKWDRLNEEIDEAHNLVEATGNSFLTENFRESVASLKAREASVKNENAYDYYLDLENIAGSDEDYINILENMARCEVFIPSQQPEDEKYQVPQFLTCQVISKVVLVKATFEMMKGNPGRALHLLSLDYRLAQHITKSGSLIGLFIGVTVKSITGAGMYLYLENACVTPDDVDEFYSMLRNMRKDDLPLAENGDQLRKIFIFAAGVDDEELKKALVRWKVSETRIRALLAGAGARRRLLSQGDFPKKIDDFNLIADGEFPRDPFDGRPLRFFEKDDVFYIYSIGPDSKDDRAMLRYDPTNGTVSPGDVWFDFHKERQYPFPEKGELATTRAGLEEQFPNGLPFDPFHNKKGASFTIIDSDPAKIISFGPDTDASRVDDGKLLPLQPQYDPTNGIISPGDLILDTGKGRN